MAGSLLVALLAIAGLTVAARRLRLPDPLLFLIGGIALAFVPGLPPLPYDSDVVFLVFFPVLLFSTALHTSWNDLRPNALTSLRAALGTVLATTLAVGLVAHTILPGLSWTVAFLLGAILSDPDFRFFFTLAERVRLPRPMRTTLAGEGLLEGTTQIVLYLTLSAAVTSGNLAPLTLASDLLLGPLIGGGVGLAAAWTLGRVDRRLTDPAVTTTLLLAAPFVAYFPAEAVGGNRLTAVVAAGLYLGWTHDVTQSPLARLSGGAVLTSLVLLVNGFIYLPAGLALPDLLGRVEQSSFELVTWTLAITLTALVVRVAWIFGAGSMISALRRRVDPGAQMSRAAMVLQSWAATRGAFAVASALALPLVTESGVPFPQRDLLIALSLSVALLSIAVQGLTLPVLLRHLHLPEDYRGERELALARRSTASAALEALERLDRQGRLSTKVAEILRPHYEDRLERYGAAGDDGAVGSTPDAGVRLGLLDAERTGLRRLRDDNSISDAVFRQVQREIDLAEEYFRT